MKKVLLFMIVTLVSMSMLSAATITVTKPASGKYVGKGSPYTIQWTKSGAQDASVKIRLYNPAGTTKILDITNSTANDGSFSWPVPNTVAIGTYVVRVKTIDNSVFDDSGVFTIGNTLTPVAAITVTKPATGETLAKGSSYNIKWTKSGAQDALVKIRLYNPAGTTKILDIINSTANDGSFNWPVPNSVANGSYVVRVKTLDNADYDDSGVFTIASASTPEPEAPSYTLVVYKPSQNSLHSYPGSMDIRWKRLGKIAFPRRSNRTNAALKSSFFLQKRNVKIEIISAKCPVNKPELLNFYKLRFPKSNFSIRQLKLLVNLPWKFYFPRWKTIIAKTPDDGFYTWNIPSNYNKGCYKVRVTELPVLHKLKQPLKPVRGTSGIFRIIPSPSVEILKEIDVASGR